MNPFTGPLTRFGFFVWTFAYSVVVLFAFISFMDGVKGSHKGKYWLAYRLIFVFLLIGVSILAYLRRIQDAGLSKSLIVLWLVPIADVIFWFILLSLPSKGQIKAKSS
jgi:uncharacterized membrane protein YhaH (DUF805 family)